MTEIGKYNRLRVVKEVDFGLYLEGEPFGEILLPQKYVPQNCTIDDWIEVFIYLDSEDRIIATTQRPLAVVGECAMLRVVSATPVGAFLDWGLPKDLLVPFREQKEKMKQGQRCIVYVYLDEKSNRIAASSRLDKYLDKEKADFINGQEVNLLIAEETEIGYKAIVNNRHWGLLYKNMLFQPLVRGQRIKGFIDKIREDGKIDLTLHKPGYDKVNELAQKILALLKKEGGTLALTDKTPPETIYRLFGVSKKTYKKAVGALFKQKAIVINDNGLMLSKKK